MTCEPTGFECDNPDHRKGQNGVYWMQDHYGQMLYIGITKHYHSRMRSHAKTKFWWGDVQTIGWFPYPTREEALEIEAQGIDSANPKYNRARNVPYEDCVAAAIADPRYQELREMVD